MFQSIGNFFSLSHAPQSTMSPEKLTKPKDEKAQREFLEQYDFFVLIDKSGSMSTQDSDSDKTSRWDIVKENLKLIVQCTTEYDADGLDVCFFNNATHWQYNVDSTNAVTSLFSKYHPEGSTNLARALDETFSEHFRRRKEKSPVKEQKSIVLIITDGLPDDQHAVRNVIIQNVKKLSKSLFFSFEDQGSKTASLKTREIGIRFFQVGNDPQATRYLQHLDDHLQDAQVDIVDTGNIDELCNKASVREALVNSIFD